MHIGGRSRLSRMKMESPGGHRRARSPSSLQATTSRQLTEPATSLKNSPGVAVTLQIAFLMSFSFTACLFDRLFAMMFAIALDIASSEATLFRTSDSLLFFGGISI